MSAVSHLSYINCN